MAIASASLTNGTPVTIDEADRVLRSRMAAAAPAAAPPAAQLPAAGAPAIGCAVGSSQPAEIATLAASLKCDPDLIFEYVYNNIEYEPLFGSNKGPLGTLLDLRGNDIDQARLLMALLGAAGFPTTSATAGARSGAAWSRSTALCWHRHKQPAMPRPPSRCSAKASR
ncbi:MAG TPA: hypothetical protein VFQ90_14650 [Stellaceae bacterium]|nr:hypothetical protein [Stellaceae bacterium]